MNCPTCNKKNRKTATQCRHCGALMPRRSARLLDSMTMNPAMALSIGIALLVFSAILLFNGLIWFAVLPTLCGLAFTALGLKMRD